MILDSLIEMFDPRAKVDFYYFKDRRGKLQMNLKHTTNMKKALKIILLEGSRLTHFFYSKMYIIPRLNNSQLGHISRTDYENNR